MKRTNKSYDENNKEVPEGKAYIERRILIGAITDTDYLGKIRGLEPHKFMQATACRKVLSWCMAYYDDYKEAPGKNIESIYFEKLKDNQISDDEAEELEEDILPGLSEEYERAGETNSKYLYDSTINYFQNRQMELYAGQLQELTDQGDIDGALELQNTFKLLQAAETEAEELTIKDYYEMDIEPPDYLVDDLIPKGLTLLAGKPKTGKSFWSLNLSIHLAQGRRMFGNEDYRGFRGRQGAILHLALEDPAKRIKNRLHKICPDPDLETLNKNLEIKRGWPKLHRGGLQRLEEWLEAQENPELIVIDVITKVANISTSTRAGRWYQEEYKAYGPLADLAHTHNCAILMLTHTVKGKKGDVFDEILGGSGTQGPADNMMVLSRGNQSSQRELAIRGKDIEDGQWMFDVAKDGAQWKWLGDAGEVQKTDERQEIYDYLKKEGPLELKEIKQACKDGLIGASRNSVNTILRKMTKEGKIEQPQKYGPYAVDGYNQNIVDIKVAQRMKGIL